MMLTGKVLPEVVQEDPPQLSVVKELITNVFAAAQLQANVLVLNGVPFCVLLTIIHSFSTRFPPQVTNT